MRILVISDLHGDLEAAWEAVERFEPDLLLSCGDWGDAGEVSEAELAAFPATLPVYTTFGNHDALDALARLRNRDGSAVLLPQGEIQTAGGVRLAAIGGIWAKSHRLRHYVTDEDVAAAAARIAAAGPVDLLLTHGCPVGLADRTPRGNHGGQRCFLEAFKTVGPRVHLCGHLHVAQERALADGRVVLNVGATPDGSVAIVEAGAEGIRARLERFKRSSATRNAQRTKQYEGDG
jgi:Icc-related predicted phosphoesterase